MFYLRIMPISPQLYKIFGYFNILAVAYISQVNSTIYETLLSFSSSSFYKAGPWHNFSLGKRSLGNCLGFCTSALSLQKSPIAEKFEVYWKKGLHLW